MRLHHVGYLVRDIARSAGAFAAMGCEPVFLCAAPPSGVSVYDESRQSDICFLSAAGGVFAAYRAYRATLGIVAHLGAFEDL